MGSTTIRNWLQQYCNLKSVRLLSELKDFMILDFRIGEIIPDTKTKEYVINSNVTLNLCITGNLSEKMRDKLTITTI
jgi:hypothetical protein